MSGDSFRNRRNGFTTMDGGQMPRSKKSGGKIAGIVIAAFVVLLLGLNSTYEIKEQEQAVLITLGQATAVTDPGLHFKIPFIQRVRKVNTTIQGFKVGYDSEGQTVPNEAIMITSDFNFVGIDFYVEYRVSDPVKAVFASGQPEDILRNLAQSCIRTVVSNYDVDSVLTTGKNEIQSNIREMLLSQLEEQDIGLQLVNITIQDSTPPTMEVLEAFKDVETAKQGKETAINKSYMAFVLADHSKFRRVYPVTFAPLQKCCIITDKLRCRKANFIIAGLKILRPSFSGHSRLSCYLKMHRRNYTHLHCYV